MEGRRRSDLLGIAAGVSYGALWWILEKYAQADAYVDGLYLPLLFPVRMVEWLLILWLFFERTHAGRKRLLGYAVGGTAWSYILDVAGIALAWVAPGGVWVC